MVGNDNYYQLLGVKRTASAEQIKRAYRTRLKEVHPDLCRNDNLACEKTRQILEAYHALTESDDVNIHQNREIEENSPHIVFSTTGYEEYNNHSAVLLFAIPAMLILCMLLWLYASERKTPVFRPVLIDSSYLNYSGGNYTQIAEPGITECEQWCAARRYNNMNGTDYAKVVLIGVYAAAIRESGIMRDSRRKQFYKQAVEHLNSPRQMGDSISMKQVNPGFYGSSD